MSYSDNRIPLGTENPAYTLEKFLTLLRKQEQEVEELKAGILKSNTVVPHYVDMLLKSIHDARLMSLEEAAKAAERVKQYGESIHDKFIIDAKEVIDRMGDRPRSMARDIQPIANAPSPADLVYVGAQYTVAVTPTNQGGPNDTQTTDR